MSKDRGYWSLGWKTSEAIYRLISKQINLPIIGVPNIKCRGNSVTWRVRAKSNGSIVDYNGIFQKHEVASKEQELVGVFNT